MAAPRHPRRLHPGIRPPNKGAETESKTGALTNLNCASCTRGSQGHALSRMHHLQTGLSETGGATYRTGHHCQVPGGVHHLHSEPAEATGGARAPGRRHTADHLMSRLGRAVRAPQPALQVFQPASQTQSRSQLHRQCLGQPALKCHLNLLTYLTLLQSLPGKLFLGKLLLALCLNQSVLGLGWYGHDARPAPCSTLGFDGPWNDMG